MHVCGGQRLISGVSITLQLIFETESLTGPEAPQFRQPRWLESSSILLPPPPQVCLVTLWQGARAQTQVLVPGW